MSSAEIEDHPNGSIEKGCLELLGSLYLPIISVGGELDGISAGSLTQYWRVCSAFSGKALHEKAFGSSSLDNSIVRYVLHNDEEEKNEAIERKSQKVST